MYNILLGGAAGDGIETMAVLLEKILKKSGYYLFSNRDFMSRVRGGHNFIQIRFGTEPVVGHCEELDGIFAMNDETISIHKGDLKEDGFILADSSRNSQDTRTISLPLIEIAKECGNAKTITSVAVGVVLSLFGVDINNIKPIMGSFFKQSLIDANVSAAEKGYSLIETRFRNEGNNLDGNILVSGTKASTLGAIAAGLKFYSAYPMSPSTGILDYLQENGESLNIVVEQAEDEIAAINMAIGAAYAGAPAMTGTSGGGFCLMTEAVGFAGIAEVPLVIIDVQRPGPATGLPTRTEQSDLKFVISAAQGEFPRMVIALRHHEDAFYQTARAFGLAQKYQIPVIILSDQYLGDSTAVIPKFDTGKLYKVNQETVKFSIPYKSYECTQNGISTRLIPGKSEHLVCVDSDEHDEYGHITESAEVRTQMMEKRLGKLARIKEDLIEPEFIGNEQCETLLVGFGSVYGAVKEAIEILNKEDGRYGALIFGDIYPLPTRLLKRFASKSYKVISIEQNATGQLASLIREATLIQCRQSILKYDGRQLTAAFIIESIKNPQRGRRE